MIWHPCTQMKDHENFPIIKIKSGRGAMLFDENGKSYIDAISSWWTNIFGHSNQRINRAIFEQAQKLEHVIFAGFTHEKAEELASRLLKLTKGNFQHVFFAGGDGSSAVEAAIKMSYQYHLEKGEERKRFIALNYGYHGETLGALSLCGEDLYRKKYDSIIMKNIFVKGPDCYRCPFGKNRETCNGECFIFMEKALEKYHKDVNAVVVEPLVQCAGGFKIYPPIYLKKLRDTCDRFNIHLIVDEIATGFRRTGTMFAEEQAEIWGDFICLGKTMTGGYLPLSAVLTKNEIYNVFYDDYASLKAFLHSHSYTGNPLACAAACEVLNIFEEKNWLKELEQKASLVMENMGNFKDFKYIGEIRQRGFITAIELVKDKDTKERFDWKKRIGFEIYKIALNKGAILRPLGDVIYFMPPYVITCDEIKKMCDIAKDSIYEFFKGK